MNSNGNGPTPPPELVAPMGSQGYQQQQEPRRASGEVSVVRLNMPLRWVAGIVIAVAGGVFSIGGVLWRTESHAGDHAAHLSADVAQGGGVVSKRTLRRVLRTMQIKCSAAAGGGLACTVDLPEEAD